MPATFKMVIPMSMRKSGLKILVIFSSEKHFVMSGAIFCGQMFAFVCAKVMAAAPTAALPPMIAIKSRGLVMMSPSRRKVVAVIWRMLEVTAWTKDSPTSRPETNKAKKPKVKEAAVLASFPMGRSPSWKARESFCGVGSSVFESYLHPTCVNHLISNPKDKKQESCQKKKANASRC